MSSTYTATIGLEVHAELSTKSKMFCGCKNEPHDTEPNTNVCPVCMAHPGSLPVPNQDAIEKVLLFGRAVGATQADYSEFDRKNYFYPDIPKAYQISQYAYPFLSGGSLLGVTLTRVHLEEDTARSQHEHGDFSLVDFNRAGVPLMELVTEPVIHDAKTAGDFARELQLLLQTLQISGAQMERGEMRVEANISVSKTSEFGTKVEVKNLNSFRSVESAITYEIKRQIELLERGESVKQETRGWDEVKLRTFSQRSKETAKDYRYFPDPDIPKIKTTVFSDFSSSRLDEKLPELPSELRLKYEKLGLPSKQIELIISSVEFGKFYNQLFELTRNANNQSELAKLGANYLTTDIAALVISGAAFNLSAENFAKLLVMVHEGAINSRVAKDILAEILTSDADPKSLANERGLLQSSDPEALRALVLELLAESKAAVDEYKAGKVSVVQFLVGVGMKKSRGTANPTVLRELIEDSLQKSL